MTGQTPLRFGLIGTGYWARRTHAEGLVRHSGVELAGVWGRSGAARFADELGIRSYRDVDELFEDVDAVAFAVPPDIQAELATRAAQRHCHLLLEKPTALDVARAEQLACAAETAGIRAAVFFTLLYEPAMATWLAQQSTQSWVAGRIRIYSSIYGPGSPYARSDWRRARGALWDIGPHAVSVALRVLGPIDSVVARRGPGDAIEIIICHAAGATSTVSLSLTAPEAACGSDWTFYGRSGAVSLPLPATTSRAAFDSCLDDMLHAVRNGTDPRCDVRFGSNVVRTLAAAESSAAT